MTETIDMEVTFNKMNGTEEIDWIQNNPTDAARIIWYLQGRLSAGR